jgi:hypothetical protein
VLTSWSAVVNLGAGLSATLAPHLALVLEAQGMLFLPPIEVQIGDASASQFLGPSVLVNAGLCASF